MKPIVAPPYEAQRRAWECAYVLRSEFAGHLALGDRIIIEEIYLVGPDALGWSDIRAMLVLYGAVAVAVAGVRA